MIYQFEHEGIEACGDCPCCDSIGGCALGGSVESLDKVPDDCPLVAISKTETTSAKKIAVDIQLRPMLDELEVDIDEVKEYISKLN